MNARSPFNPPGALHGLPPMIPGDLLRVVDEIDTVRTLIVCGCLAGQAVDDGGTFIALLHVIDDKLIAVRAGIDASRTGRSGQ